MWCSRPKVAVTVSPVLARHMSAQCGFIPRYMHLPCKSLSTVTQIDRHEEMGAESGHSIGSLVAMPSLETVNCLGTLQHKIPPSRAPWKSYACLPRKA